MKALTLHTKVIKKATCWLASFTLAFSLFGTPAYAGLAAEEEAAQLGISEQVEPTALQPSDMALDPAANASEVTANALQAATEEGTEGTATSGTGSTEGNPPLAEGIDSGNPPLEVKADTPFELTTTATYDPATNSIAYTITIVNPTSNAYKEVGLDSNLTYTSDANKRPEGAPYQLDLPNVIDVEANQTLTYTATLVVDPAFTCESNPSVTAFVSVVNPGDNPKLVETATPLTPCDNKPAAPAVELTGWVEDASKLYDEAGELVTVQGSEGYIEYAMPGYMVEYTFTIENTSTVVAEGVVATPNANYTLVGDWTTPRTLQPGDTMQLVAQYLVTEADNPSDGSDGYVPANITVTSGEYSLDIVNSHYKVGKPNYSYTISYSTEDGIDLGTEEFVEVYGPFTNLSEDVINLNLPDGYMPQQRRTNITLSEDASQNHFEVIYEAVRTNLPYRVDFYRGETYITSVESTASYRDEISLDLEFLNSNLPAKGYKAIEEARTHTMGKTAEENIIRVTYEPEEYMYQVFFFTEDETQIPFNSFGENAPYGSTVTLTPEILNQSEFLPNGYAGKTEPITINITDDEEANKVFVTFNRAQYKVTVNYFVGNTLLSNQIGTYETSALYYSDFEVSAALQNKYLPDGYKAKTDDAAYSHRVRTNDYYNTINVVYEPDTFEYSINYYTEDGQLLNHFNASGVFGSTIYPSLLNDSVPAGYQPIEERQGLTIKSDPSQNVLNLIYKKRTDLGYTVNYYKDEVSGTPLGSTTATGVFGADIPYEVGKYLPVGYASDASIEGATTISANPSGNVLNVVYQTKNTYGYTVNYYKDSIDTANWLGSEEKSGEYGSEVSYTEGRFAPEDYVASQYAVSGITQVGSNEAENVVNVVYTEKAISGYTINYYLEDALTNSTVGSGIIGQPIAAVNGAFMPVGYELSRTDGATIIGDNPADNVLNVYYTKASFDYTVNYYRDYIDDTTLLGSDTATGVYTSVIPYEQGRFLPVGYAAAGTVTGASTVSYDVSANVLNVVYTPDRFNFVVNYYKGSKTPENLISTTTEAARYGTTVPLSSEELNGYCPEGFVPATQGFSVQITEDVAKNTRDVIFNPDFDEFYAAGLESVSAVYNGQTYVLAPKGLVNGDVVTITVGDVQNTYTVGVDENIAAEFKDVTNGEVAVSATVTRAGVESSAVSAVVNITPAPAPVKPVVPGTETGNTGVNGGATGEGGVTGGADSGTAGGSSAAGVTPLVPYDAPLAGGISIGALEQEFPEIMAAASANPVEQAIQVAAAVVNPIIGAPTPENLTAEAPAAPETPEAPEAPATETISDDANPLASNPYGTLQNAKGVTFVLLIISVCFAAAGVALFGLRKRIVAKVVTVSEGEGSEGASAASGGIAGASSLSASKFIGNAIMILAGASVISYAAWLFTQI